MRSRVIRIFPEYGTDWPLWGDTGQLDEDEIVLSDALRSRVRSWAQFWLTHFHHDEGWDSPARAESWRREGDQVVALLRRELSGTADVLLGP